MWMRAFDGTAWSDWDPFTLITTSAAPGPNDGPVATIDNQVMHTNTSAGVQGLVTAIDPDGDPVTFFQFYDAGTAAGSGYFSVNGVQRAAGQYINVAASQLGNVELHGGQAPGSDLMWVRAHDGVGWGAWDHFILTSENTPPVATIETQNRANNEWVPLPSILTTGDADGDAITQYQFYDAGSAADSGYFWTVDVGQRAADTYITVNAADLGTTWVRGGVAAGSELMWVRAFDGTEWSAWDPFNLNSGLA